MQILISHNHGFLTTTRTNEPDQNLINDRNCWRHPHHFVVVLGDSGHFVPREFADTTRPLQHREAIDWERRLLAILDSLVDAICMSPLDKCSFLEPKNPPTQYWHLSLSISENILFCLSGVYNSIPVSSFIVNKVSF